MDCCDLVSPMQYDGGGGGGGITREECVQIATQVSTQIANDVTGSKLLPVNEHIDEVSSVADTALEDSEQNAIDIDNLKKKVNNISDNLNENDTVNKGNTALQELEVNPNTGLSITDKVNNKQILSGVPATDNTIGMVKPDGTTTDVSPNGTISSKGGSSGTVKTVAGIPADAGGNVPLKASDINAYTKAQTDLAVGGVAAECTNLQNQITTNNNNMKSIKSVVKVNNVEQATTPMDTVNWKLLVPITVDIPPTPVPVTVTNGIPVYGFDGTYNKVFDPDVIPTVVVTDIKKPLPTKKLYVSIQKIMPSYYPDTFYYLAVTLNTGFVSTSNSRTALYSGYNLNYSDMIKSFGGSNTLPLIVRFTDLSNGSNFDITIICDKTSNDMSSMDNFAYFIKSKVNSDPTYGTKAQAVSFMCRWNSDTNRMELSANYNALFTLALSPKTNPLAVTLKLVSPCIATWTVGSVMNTLQSGSPVLADIQNAITANGGALGVSFNFAVSGALTGLIIKMEDVPSLAGFATIMTDYMRTKTVTKAAYPKFTMTYDGSKFNISNGTIDQILISPDGIGNNVLKISQAGYAGISTSSSINIAVSPFSCTRVSYQLSVINDHEEALDTIARFKVLQVSHNPIIVSHEVFASLINNVDIDINDFTTDTLHLNNLNAAINLTVNNEWITFRFDFSIIAQKYYLCTSNQTLIEISSTKYSDQGTISNYPTRKVATWDVYSDSVSKWCLTDVLSEFGLIFINQLQQIYYDGTDINQGGSNGNILYIPINLPLNRMQLDFWQIQIPVIGSSALAKITTLRLVILAQDDNLPDVPYSVQGKYKKINGRIQYKEDIAIPATGSYPEIPASQNNPVITLTCINNDITINTSWTNSSGTALSTNMQTLQLLGGQSDLSLGVADSKIIGPVHGEVTGDPLFTIVQNPLETENFVTVVVPSGNVYTIKVKGSLSLTDQLQSNTIVNIGMINMNDKTCKFASITPKDECNDPVYFGLNQDLFFSLDTTGYSEDQIYRFIIFTTNPELRKKISKSKRSTISGSYARINKLLSFTVIKE